MHKKVRATLYGIISLVVLTLLAALAISCQGPVGLEGPAGTPGKSSGTISGTVTSSLTQTPVAGVAVSTDPVIKDVTITSGADGGYTAELPIGTYKLTFKKGNFTSATETVTLVAGQTVTKDVVLKPVAAVVVNAGTDQNTSPDASVTLKATTESLDGSTATGYKWTQIAGVTARIGNPDSNTITVTLGNAKSYKEELLRALNMQDRFTVLAINPFALEEAETATFKVTVTTSSGTYSDTVNVVAALPYVVNGGLANVPVGLPVLVHGKTQSYYTWVLTAPTDSKAAVDNPRGQNPAFTPDVAGKYVLTEKVTGATLDVYAGTWAGAITGLDAKGLPLSAGCTVCHDGKTAPNQFTAWKQSGHAAILTKNMNNPAGHWSISCASCHTVGYDPAVVNNGFDEAMAAEGWKVPPHGEVGYAAEMLKEYPKTTSLANIQCENCHGPNNSPLHANKTIDAARVSISSDVCGACHGEPPRHGRFQQWEESGHGNFETAIAETMRASCVRCHTGQGFLKYIKQGDLTLQLQGAKGNATNDEMLALGLGQDTVQPITCTTCHNVHNEGYTETGKPSVVNLRVSGDTAMLPSGFQAKDVGMGALCMTCHNTRNLLHNDANPPTSYTGPHYSAQADVLMGENAYFVPASQRSPHANLKDTCVTCHMQATPPPVGFNPAGTNHSFKASPEICSDCHNEAFNGEAFMVSTEEKIKVLEQAIITNLLGKIPSQATILDYTAHTYQSKSYDVKSAALVISKSNIIGTQLAHIHGQIAFTLTLKSPVTVTYSPAGEASHSMSVTTVSFQIADLTTDGKTAVIAISDPLVKALWNFSLFESDASNGVHNPEFVKDGLDGALQALKK